MVIGTNWCRTWAIGRCVLYDIITLLSFYIIAALCGTIKACDFKGGIFTIIILTQKSQELLVLLNKAQYSFCSPGQPPLTHDSNTLYDHQHLCHSLWQLELLSNRVRSVMSSRVLSLSLSFSFFFGWRCGRPLSISGCWNIHEGFSG